MNSLLTIQLLLPQHKFAITSVKFTPERLLVCNMLINLPLNFIFHLTLLMNCMLKFNIFPDIWKKAVIFPLTKPGLDDYCPTQLLTNKFTFLFLRLTSLCYRLDKFIHSSGMLLLEQFGFCTHTITHSNSCGMSEIIHDTLNLEQVACAVFVDLSKAFDTIYINGLMFKLLQLNTPKQLVKILHD